MNTQLENTFGNESVSAGVPNSGEYSSVTTLKAGVGRPPLSTTWRLAASAKALIAIISFAVVAINSAWGQSAGDYRSAQSGNWNAVATWETFNGSSWVAAASTPTSSNGVINVLSGHNVTVTAHVTVDQLVVAAGATLTVKQDGSSGNVTVTVANGPGTDVAVFGTVVENGTAINVGKFVSNAGASIAFESGGKFQLNYHTSTTGGIIPTATWHPDSTLEFIGITTAVGANDIGQDQAFGNVTWNCGSQTSTFNLTANFTTVNGTFSILNTGTGKLQVGTTTTSTIAVGGDFVQTAGLFEFNYSSDRTMNVAGNFTLSGGTLDMATASSGSSTINVAGNFSHTGGHLTKTGVSTASITFNKTGTQNYTSGGTVSGAINFTVNSGSYLRMGTNLLGNGSTGTFTLSSGAALGIGDPAGIASSGASGNIRVSGARSFNTGADYVYNASAAQVPGNGLPSTVRHFTVDNSGGPSVGLTIATNLTLTGDLDVSAGILDLAGFTVNRNAVGGTLTLAANTTLKVGNTFPANFATRNLSASSTVEYTGSGSQTVPGETYGNLAFSNGSANAKTLAAAATVAGDLTINSGATFNAGSAPLNVQGNWTNNGAFTPSISTVTLSGSGKNLSPGGAGFNALIISGSYSTAGALTVSGAATISGSFAAGINTCSFGGDFQNSGTFTSSGAVNFDGTGASSLALNSGFASSGTVNFNGSVAPTFSETTSPTFRHLNVANTAGIAPAVGWNIGGDFSVSLAGAGFNGGSFTHTFYGNFTNAGTVTSSGVLNFAPTNAVTLSLRGTAFSNSGTVKFGGSGQITLSGGAPTFNNVQILNTHAAGVTPSVNWTVNGALSIGTGSALFGGNGLTHTIGGNWFVNGAFSGGTSTVIMNPATAGQISGMGTTTFNNWSINGNVTSLADVFVSGNFTNTGTLDATGSDVTFNGSSAAVIAGSATTFDSLVIAKSSATVTLAANLNAPTALTISSGTLDTATFSVNQAAPSGTLTVAAGATLKIGGNSSLPAFNTYSLDPASVVDYSGEGTQTIAAQNYGNLTSSSSGARVLEGAGTIGVAGTFTPGANSYTVTGSTIDFNSAGAQTIPAFNYHNLTASSTGARTLATGGTIGVAGAFTPGANSYTITGSTIAFNGAAQTIPAFTYQNLTTGGSGTKTLGGDITVRSALTLTAGTLADAGFTATVNGDVANSAAHTGTGKVLLAGGTTSHILSGGGTISNLELNDTNNATLSTTDLTVAGTLTLTSGKIETGTNKVFINADGSVSRTSGYVLGNLQKNVPAGSTSRTFEVGDATTYAPAALSFNNVTTPGNVTVSTTAGDHPDIANSEIAPLRSANRYWMIANSGLVFDDYSATFHFTAGDLDGSADTSQFIVAILSGTNWSHPVAGTRTSTNTQAIGIASFGQFQIGESALAPTISTQPQSQRINIGDSVTFTVEASGANPRAYQWRFNGANLSGATTTSFTIASVQDADAGNYSVVITNLNGSNTSASAALTINHAPSLAAISNQTNNEEALLTVAASASDPDGGVLSYELLAAPGGAAIDSSGVITWTPTEAQGPSTNVLIVRVADDGSPALSATNSFTVVVREVNSTPTLVAPADQMLPAGVPLSVTATASDTDIPGNALTFKVVSGPSGLKINATNGLVTWTPATRPSTNVVTLRVTDNGAPNLSDVKSFVVIALEPPDVTKPVVQIVSPSPNWETNAAVITVTGTARDNRLLAQVLYSLNGAPFVPAVGTTNWSADIMLAVATNTFAVKSVDSSSNESSAVIRKYFLIVNSVLTVQTNGSGTVSPDLNGAELKVGRSYSMTAAPGLNYLFTNWTGGVSGSAPKLTFLMQTNLVLQANFITNKFIGASGAYNGLFSDPAGVSHQSAGFLTLRSTSKQTFSGKLLVDGGTHAFRGKLDLGGRANVAVKRKGKLSVTLNVQLVLDADSNRAIGTVSNSSWAASLLADRAMFNLSNNPATDYAGRYTMVVNGYTNGVIAPGGNGYGLIGVGTNGVVSLAGAFGDGAAIKQVVPISENGDWPFYVPLYSTPFAYTNDQGTVITNKQFAGSLIGWLNFTNSGVRLLNGALFSTKTPVATHRYYPNGFTNEFQLLASAYTPPPPGVRAVNIAQGETVLQDGNLPVVLSNAVTVATNNRITVIGANQSGLKLTLSPKTGLLKGAFVHPGNTNAPTTIAGAVLQNYDRAAGFFLGTNQSGSISLEGN